MQALDESESQRNVEHSGREITGKKIKLKRYSVSFGLDTTGMKKYEKTCLNLSAESKSSKID